MFAHVVDAGSFTAAAQITQIPKSTISRRIANLEKSLGAHLLARTTRRLRLTEVGDIYYQHCRRMIEEAESAEISVNQLMGKPKGTLRINTSTTIGQHLLGPLLSEFLTTYPDIDIQLLTTNRVVHLIDEGFDLAIRVGVLADSSLISKYLGATRLKCYASVGYLAEMGEPTTPEHLINHRCISMSNKLQINSWQLENNKNKIKDISIKNKVVVYDFTILRELVLNNTGIGMLPNYLVKNKPYCSDIQRVLPAWRSPKIELHAIYPSRRGMTPKLRVFLDFISEKFRDDNLFSDN
ncbi:MAG: LysR family transcriptional regulator [Algicola sp.]|nr:LysR family transcriptional regulator [Algicola sp.]